MKKNLLYLLLFTSFNLSAQTNDYLEFNGMQDGVRVSHLPSYNTITSELTVSAWFYQDASLLNNVDLGTINPVVSKHFRKPEPMSPLVFDCGPYMYGGASDFYYSIGGTSGYIRGNIPNMIVNDTWQHFLMSVKNDSLKLFIDGNLVESISIGSDFVFNTNPDDIEIGYRQDNPANNTYTFPGKIRHVFILNRGIEESELTTLMYGGPSLLDPNLLGYWVLDEGTGAIAYDLSPNLNNGIHQETLNWVSSNLVLDYCTLTVDKTSIFEGDSATITATLSEVSATETVIKFTPSGSALFDGDYTVNYSGKGAMSTDSVGYSSLAGIAIDASGNTYLVDQSDNSIQKWAPGDTIGTTVAGGNGWGSAANQLANPYALAVDASGNVYVADSQNHRIQKVTNGPQIIIPSGQTSAAIIVKAISDGIGERDETIFLTPSATGATLTSSDAISLIINSTPPTMVITSEEGSDGFTSEDSTLSLSFTSNESTIDFSIEDITVTGGVISTFVAISETIYTATFTPLEEGDKTIDVAAGTFKNVVGNGNIAAAQFNWKYDIENSPQLSDVAFTLAENSVNGTSLGILEASDADGDTLTYLIISGNDAEAFSLGSVSGALTVSTSSALDFETTPAFNLAIQVSDGALSDSATVTINLTDVDETTLSLADASEMIYPNPTDGIVNIKMAEFKEATIYNLSGKRIMRSIDNRIDVSALSEGVYIIKLENRSGDRFSTRLIKE